MKQLRVVAWTDHYYGPDHLRTRKFTLDGQTVELTLTAERGGLDQADAVWFHGPSIRDLPDKRPGQPWVLMSMESDTLYPFQAGPDAAELFEIRMTYRLDSDVPAPYVNWSEYEGFEAPAPARAGRSAGAVAVYLASNPVRWRDEYVAELMEHLPVDSLGRCLSNRDIVEVAGPDEGDLARQAIAAVRAYKFVLAFENSIATDYATEKLYRPLAYGTVPVYLGAPNVRDLTPDDDSVIVVSDFGSPRELADHLLELDADDDAYQRHHRWRGGRYDARFRRLVDVGSTDPMTRLARKLIHGCDRSCPCGGRLREPGVLP